MKIAIVSPFIASSSDNSFYASQHLYIAAGLAQCGAHVEIFTMDRADRGARTEILDSNGNPILIHYLPQVSQLLTQSNLAMMKGLVGILRKGQFDIIQVSEDTQPTSLQVSLLKAGRHLTIFQGINEYSRNPIKGSLMRLFDRSLGIILKSHVSLVVAKTHQAADFIGKKGYRNVVTIPMGVDTELFFPQDKKRARKYLSELGVNPKGVLALYVGNLIPRRDLTSIVEGLSIARQSGIDIELLVVGCGPEKEKLTALTKQNEIDNAVHFLRPIPNRKMPLVYSAADVFVFTPLYEIFGMVLLEAMACGLPIIATQVPAVKDIIASSDKSGILAVSFASAKDVAKHLEILAHNSEKARILGKNAAETAAHFSWSNISTNLYNAYSQLMQ